MSSKKRVRKKSLLAHPTLALEQNINFLEDTTLPDEHYHREHGDTTTHKRKVHEPLVAQNEKQKEYIRAIIENPQVIVVGSSGTGKTYIASKMAVDMLRRGEIEKIVLTRPNVTQSKSLGFFKGTMEEKLAPWVVPFTDVFEADLGKTHFEYLVKKGVIDVVPFEVMRGRTFNDSFVVLDEAQNVTIAEMKMFLTRIGKNSKVIMNGDVRQCDIRSESGLKHTIFLASKYRIPVPVIEFTYHDIVRSATCQMWVKAFESEEQP